MLNANRRVTVAIVTVLILAMIDFMSNVWVSIGSDKDLIPSGNIQSFQSKHAKPRQLPSVNRLFGMPVDEESSNALTKEQLLEQERLAQAQAEKEQRERERQQLLSIGEDNIRLFGVSLSASKSIAMLSVNLMNVNAKMEQRNEGETFYLAEDEIAITLVKVHVDAVDLEIKNSVSGKTDTFKLVMFEYEI